MAITIDWKHWKKRHSEQHVQMMTLSCIRDVIECGHNLQAALYDFEQGKLSKDDLLIAVRNNAKYIVDNGKCAFDLVEQET